MGSEFPCSLWEDVSGSSFLRTRHSNSKSVRCPGLTLGGTVKGDPVKDIIKTAFDNGINMFDTAEAYASGKSEEEMCAFQFSILL